MKQYDSYKPSLSGWFSVLPAHWDETKIKYFCLDIINGATPSTSNDKFWDGDIAWIASGKCHDCVIDSESKFITKEGYDNSSTRLIPPNTALVALTGATCAQSGFLTISSCTNQSIVAYINHPKKMDSKFIFYMIQGNRQQYLIHQTGGAQAGINVEDCKNIISPIPPISEQEAIASYHDKKCNSIDKLIATQEKRIALLGELKQSIITEAVTRGLNPDAPLKDSGIDWIGKIPEHWEVRRLKYWLKSPLMYGANEAPDNSDLSDPRYIRITDIDDNGYLKDDTFCTLCLNTAEPYLLDKGDILFARSGATVGKTYIHRTEDKACFAGYLIKAKINKDVGDCEYLYLYTKTSIFSNWKDSINIQATIQNIGADKYANLFITYPPISEQIEVAEFLKCQVKPLDSAITKAKREVELLREYKQTIITEAVTGKIKVC